VVKDDSEVVGVMSSRDAGGRMGFVLRQQSRVADLMTRTVATVSPDTTIRRVANLMQGHSIGCLPVVDGGRVVGILTVSDLLQLLGRGVERPARPVRRGLHHRVPHRKQKTASGMW
jgi:CBS domain-containing protein